MVRSTGCWLNMRLRSREDRHDLYGMGLRYGATWSSNGPPSSAGFLHHRVRREIVQQKPWMICACCSGSVNKQLTCVSELLTPLWNDHSIQKQRDEGSLVQWYLVEDQQKGA
jgi:hypothetical protein